MIIKREDVIRNAQQYLNMQAWSPLSDTHIFNEANFNYTFHSAFTSCENNGVAGVCRRREYDVMPYVFGGFDTVTGFRNRINSQTCPGGWDRESGRSTKQLYDAAPEGSGYIVPSNLAGIDCSGYVSQCWGLTRKYPTGELPNLCLEISKYSLKQGDILNTSGHVRIFDSPAGANRINIYEAVGGGRNRPYNNNDKIGRVVCRALGWDELYIPYSPFPQFIELNPAPGSYLKSQNPIPKVSVKCKGSGDIEILNFGINEQSVTFEQSRGSGFIEASYTTNTDFSLGRYRVEIIAINRVNGQSFQDDFSWEFDLT